MARIELVSSTSSSISLRVIELTYLNSYNTLNNSAYPRYGNITITLSGAGSIPVYMSNAGSSSGNYGYTTTCNFTGLIANYTYTASARIVYYNSNYPSDSTSWGTSELTLTVKTDALSRPSFFYWTYPKTSGGNTNLTATEWNSLCSNINIIRNYKGLSNYSFSTAYSGGNFTASHYNQAVYAIRGMAGSLVLSLVYTGDTVYASLLNNLVSVLNSIT